MDLRIRRTNQHINKAFIKLVAQKGFDKVTIQDIASEAMINRATFYAHYKDKQDLFDQILAGFMQNFTKLLQNGAVVSENNLEIEQIKKILTQFYKYLKDHPDLAQALIHGVTKEILTEKFLSILKEQYSDLFQTLEVKNNDTIVPIDFVSAYLTGIFVGTLVWWVENQDKLTPEKLANLVITLISNGHLTVIGINVNHGQF
ncbi:MAG: TetR/AcrR family transcriptional regulator [Streptococcaceae bacterium]|jgi:AcrR family transcriptional regulator|nr:TetR/AcrR family transcriptional regulator [Streptococcaceae bacterium]